MDNSLTRRKQCEIICISFQLLEYICNKICFFERILTLVIWALVYNFEAVLVNLGKMIFEIYGMKDIALYQAAEMVGRGNQGGSPITICRRMLAPVICNSVACPNAHVQYWRRMGNRQWKTLSTIIWTCSLQVIIILHTHPSVTSHRVWKKVSYWLLNIS